MRSILLLALLTACGGGSDDGPRPKTFGGDRPVDLRTPATLTDGKRYPLVVVLHGFGASGFVQFAYFGLGSLLETDAALVLAPDGTLDSNNRQFWNADSACCDFEGKNPDDVTYLATLVEDVRAEWPVDDVFILGHSNGGYMAYRMACERADLFAGIISLAGNAQSNAAGCTPSEPVHVVHMHGTADAVVPYDGTNGAVASVTQWASKNGCATTRQPSGELDLDTSVAGAETMREVTDGCPDGGSVELWRMQGSSHIPTFTSTFATGTLLLWIAASTR